MANKLWANLKSDIPAGIVVFLVALPLCLGIALASGAPLISGLIAGIVGGIVIGALSGSPFSVSGPAAGLTAIVFSAIATLGSYETFLAAVVLAGVLQLALGFAGAGIINAYIPSNVIKGMLSAIGIIIIMKQIPYALGAHGDYEGNLTFIEADGSNTFLTALRDLLHIHIGAVIVTLCSMAVMLLWDKPFMRKVQMVPGALMAVLVGVVISEGFRLSGQASLIVDGDKLVNIPLFQSFADIKNQLATPDFSKLATAPVILTAITIAAVASIETLLNLEAVDKLDPLRRTTSANRELKAQGVGNIVSALAGGLPVTSVIVRSSANVNAGAKSKSSAVVHGILLLVCTFTIPFILNRIPLSALAAILLLTGYKLAKISVFKEMFAKGKYQWVPFVTTIVAVVFTDLLKGVMIGLAVSIFAILRGSIKMPYYFHRRQTKQGQVIHIELAQEVSFLNKASIKMTLDSLPENSHVWIDANNSQYIDYDVLELIREFKDVKAPDRDIRLDLTGFKPEYEIENTCNGISTEMEQIKAEMYHNKKLGIPSAEKELIENN